MTVEPRWAELLRRVALNDEHAVRALMGEARAGEGPAPRVGDRDGALLRISALIATDSAASSFQWAVTVALASGATEDEIVGVLYAVAAVVGSARLVLAAPSLASALGYDLDVLGDA